MSEEEPAKRKGDLPVREAAREEQPAGAREARASGPERGRDEQEREEAEEGKA